MRPGWRFIVIVALLALILFLPLRLASGLLGFVQFGLSARQVSGSVWSGKLDQAHIGALTLGTLDVGMEPAPLLLGRARLAFARPADDADGPLSGTVESGFGRRAISHVTGSIAGPGTGALPIERLTFDNLSVRFSDGTCAAASGRVTLVVGLEIAGVTLANGLSGEARCAGGRLQLPLVSQSGMERVTMTIAVDGSYAARVAVQPGDAMVATALSASGFVADSGAYVRTYRGQL